MDQETEMISTFAELYFDTEMIGEIWQSVGGLIEHIKLPKTIEVRDGDRVYTYRRDGA